MACPRIVSLALASLCVFSAAPELRAAPGDVWTVALSGGDFNQIQPAVDAAADGDVILVKPSGWPYEAFSIFDRSLTVAAQVPGTVKIKGAVRVANLEQGRSVELIDLSGEGNEDSALRVVDNFGSVRVRGGTWKGSNATDPSKFYSAVYVVGSEDVSLSECLIQGGWAFSGNPGGHGLYARNSSLALHSCTLYGGVGGFGSDPWETGEGGLGGNGAFVQGGFLFATACKIQGGTGGTGEYSSDPFGQGSGGVGGPGGVGLWVVGQSTNGSGELAQVELRQVTLIAGPGGSGGAYGYLDGPDGLPMQVNGTASVQTLPGPAATFTSDGVWTMGQPEVVTFTGQPLAQVFLVASSLPQFKWLPAKQGVLLVGGLPLLKYLGACDATGVLTRTFVPPDQSAALEARVLHWQAWMLTSGSTPAVLAGPLTMALVAPGF